LESYAAESISVILISVKNRNIVSPFLQIFSGEDHEVLDVCWDREIYEVDLDALNPIGGEVNFQLDEIGIVNVEGNLCKSSVVFSVEYNVVVVVD